MPQDQLTPLNVTKAGLQPQPCCQLMRSWSLPGTVPWFSHLPLNKESSPSPCQLEALLLQPQQKGGPLLLLLGKQATLPGTTLVLLLCTLQRASEHLPVSPGQPPDHKMQDYLSEEACPPSSATQQPINYRIPKEEEQTRILLLSGSGSRMGPRVCMEASVQDPAQREPFRCEPFISSTERWEIPGIINSIKMGWPALLTWIRGDIL